MKNSVNSSQTRLKKSITHLVVIGLLLSQIPTPAFALGEDTASLGTQSGSIFNSNSGTAGLANPFNSAPSNTALTSGLKQESNTKSVNRIQENISGVKASESGDKQAEAADGDTSESTGEAGGGASVSDALGCSAGALLGNMIASGIKSLFTSNVTGALQSQQTVPINTEKDANTKSIKNASNANADVNAYQQINGITIGASWNGVAYCIVNGLITYIADSTIAWANSGFQGNPAFLENPEAFFTTLADRQASEFISSLAYNTTGINVCEPFRVELAIALAESYGTQQGGNTSRFSCSMDQVSQNFMDFANGGGGYGYGEGGPNIDGYWSNWNQLRQDQNNPWGAYIEAGEYLRAQISVKENTAKFELGLNAGYLNFKKCEDPADAKKGSGDSCRTYTPGSLIQSSLEDTLKIPKERLVAAQKIDQVITALANALIKKALNTVLESN